MTQYLIAHVGHTSKSCEHITWWKPDSCGYTICIEKAGIYTEDEARKICTPTTLCIAIAKDLVTSLSRTTPYFRRSDGTLAKLYDGGPHQVIPNGKKEWVALMKNRLPLGNVEKPTPIGAKARAIYLPSSQGDKAA